MTTTDYPHYVYVLIDPTANNEVFYVGKGQGARIQSHEKAAAKFESEEDEAETDNTSKLGRLRAIAQSGASPVRLIIGRYETAAEAFAVEATLIHWVYGRTKLTNVAAGHNHDCIRDNGNLNEQHPGLEVQKERSNDGSFMRDVVLGPYEQHNIAARLAELREQMILMSYPFNPSERDGQDVFLSMPVKETDLFSIVITMGLNASAKVGVRLRIIGNSPSSIRLFRQYLTDNANRVGYSTGDIRGFKSNSATEPRYFVPPQWKGKTLNRADSQAIDKRIKWYFKAFGLSAADH